MISWLARISFGKWPKENVVCRLHLVAKAGLSPAHSDRKTRTAIWHPRDRKSRPRTASRSQIMNGHVLTQQSMAVPRRETGWPEQAEKRMRIEWLSSP